MNETTIYTFRNLYRMTPGKTENIFMKKNNLFQFILIIFQGKLSYNGLGQAKCCFLSAVDELLMFIKDGVMLRHISYV